MSSLRRSGMLGFSVAWFGQMVSVLGSGMTQFALAIWAWQTAGQATGLALVVFFGHFPRIVMTPLAGALVDRWNRKLVMTLSDLAAGVATIAIFALLKTGHSRTGTSAPRPRWVASSIARCATSRPLCPTLSLPRPPRKQPARWLWIPRGRLG